MGTSPWDPEVKTGPCVPTAGSEGGCAASGRGFGGPLQTRGPAGRGSGGPGASGRRPVLQSIPLHREVTGELEKYAGTCAPASRNPSRLHENLWGPPVTRTVSSGPRRSMCACADPQARRPAQLRTLPPSPRTAAPRRWTGRPRCGLINSS